MLHENEKALRAMAADLITTLDNVADTRREYVRGSTEAQTWVAVEEGLTAALIDLEAAIVKARSDAADFWGPAGDQFRRANSPLRTHNDKETIMTDLDKFLSDYATSENVLADVDLEKFRAEHGGESPLIIVRFGNKVAVINPMAVADYIDVDVHPFVDGKDASAAVLGFSPDNRFVGFTPEDTPLRSNDLPAVGLVAVVVGAQTEVKA